MRDDVGRGGYSESEIWPGFGYVFSGKKDESWFLGRRVAVLGCIVLGLVPWESGGGIAEREKASGSRLCIAIFEYLI